MRGPSALLLVLVPLVPLVPLMLTACPKPGPPPTSVAGSSVTPAPAPTSDATCVLGDLRVAIQQRMTHDDGITALLEDQRIGDTPVLFTAQRDAIANHKPGDDPGARPLVPRAPQGLIVARGAMVTQTHDDLYYVPREGGAKPTQTGTRREEYTFFLADAAWDCSSVAATVRDLKVTEGQPSAAACLPDSVRDTCAPVAFDA